MSNIYIKYLFIGDLDSGKFISEYSTNAIGSNEKKMANQIFKKLCKAEDIKYEERNIVSAKENKYYFIAYEPRIVYFSYVDETYPDRLVFAMFEEIKNENIISMINESTKELNPNGRQKLKGIIEKYQDKDKVDKIGAIPNDVNEVKVEVRKNIDKMVESVEDVQKLEEKSQFLKDASKEYEKSSKEIKRFTCWLNFKYWIILAAIILVILGIILYFILK